mmetsp:Transcript_67197/g.155971  ORF Transcript_67197/g.155971 Transcript_67197/m.155971 type:complete len:338 (-) Transcript_67197:409-1422(-)
MVRSTSSSSLRRALSLASTAYSPATLLSSAVLASWRSGGASLPAPAAGVGSAGSLRFRSPPASSTAALDPEGSSSGALLSFSCVPRAATLPLLSALSGDQSSISPDASYARACSEGCPALADVALGVKLGWTTFSSSDLSNNVLCRPPLAVTAAAASDWAAVGSSHIAAACTLLDTTTAPDSTALWTCNRSSLHGGSAVLRHPISPVWLAIALGTTSGPWCDPLSVARAHDSACGNSVAITAAAPPAAACVWSSRLHSLALLPRGSSRNSPVHGLATAPRLRETLSVTSASDGAAPERAGDTGTLRSCALLAPPAPAAPPLPCRARSQESVWLVRLN